MRTDALLGYVRRCIRMCDGKGACVCNSFTQRSISAPTMTSKDVAMTFQLSLPLINVSYEDHVASDYFDGAHVIASTLYWGNKTYAKGCSCRSCRSHVSDFDPWHASRVLPQPFTCLR